MASLVSLHVDPSSSPVHTIWRHAVTRLLTTDSRVRAWLLSHGRPLRAAGEALRLAAVITPASDTELRAEAAAALIAILGIYRDCIPHTRPIASNRRTRLAVICLEILRACELLFEMRAKRSNKNCGAWSTITGIETAKLALRIFLLWKRKGCLLTAAEESLTPAEEPPECTCGMKDVPGSEKVIVTRGTRSGRKILHLDPAFLPVNTPGSHSSSFLDPLFLTAYERRAAWLMRMFIPSGQCPVCDSREVRNTDTRYVSTVSHPGQRTVFPDVRPSHVLAETLYLIRPLIHLLLIRRYGWKSWRAWSASLLVDTISRALMVQPVDEDTLEERNRRMLQLLFYLVRSPLFDVVLGSFVSRIERSLRRIPVIGPATRSTVDILKAMQRYWFYTAAS